jgi:ABC-type transport system involved in multi-copper enzyme maturation permease subunit
MVTNITTHAPPAGAVGDGTRLARARDALAAEWLKLRSVRSSYLMILATAGVALFVAIGLANLNSAQRPYPGPRGLEDSVGYAFKGFAVAQLIMAVFGALAITGEYGSGLIRTTFTAKPQRAAVLAAKVAVVGASALIVGEALSLACLLSSQAILAGHGGASMWAPHVLPAVLGGGFYLAVVALIGVGIGAIVRHTAGAITVLVALLYLVPNIGSALPFPWNWDFANLFPSTAAQQITSVAVSPASHALQAGPSYALLAGYAIGIPCLAAWLLHRRDA